ncbi:MAG: sialidase family protein [Spirochaetia bacterium]
MSRKLLLAALAIALVGPALFADQAEQVFSALKAKNNKEVTRLLQTLALAQNFAQLDKVRGKNPELFSVKYFTGDFVSKIIFNNSASSILEYLLKAGIPFPAQLPTSLKLDAWEREKSAFDTFAQITAPDKKNEFESKDEFAARNANWKRLSDLIVSTELVVPAELALGAFNGDNGYFSLSLSLPAFHEAKQARLIEVRGLDKADIRYYIDRKNASFFKDKGFALWSTTAVISARAPGIYRLKEIQVRDNKGPVTKGIWAFSVRPTTGSANDNVVLVDNYIKGCEYDFSGTKVAGYETSVPASSGGDFSLSSAAGGPGELWHATLGAADFQSLILSPWTDHSDAGKRNWRSIVCSADGTHLAAVGDGDIWTSTDSGATWTDHSDAGGGSWRNIACSADGTQLAAVGDDDIWTSTDSGATWTKQSDAKSAAGGMYGSLIVCSADGTHLAAARIGDGDIWTSTDSGATWTDQKAAGGSWHKIACSADVTHLVAVTEGDISDIWTSADFGATWTDQKAAGSRPWSSITCSADGTHLAAAADVAVGGEYGADIWISADSGATWTKQSDAKSAAGRGALSSLVCSADGTRLAAVSASAYGGDIWISMDSGATWTDQSDAGARLWMSLACSADGTHFAAVAQNGDIWTATGSYY